MTASVKVCQPMRLWLPALDSEAGVEQQHALIRPSAQVAVIGRDKTGDAAFEFFVDVLQ